MWESDPSFDVVGYYLRCEILSSKHCRTGWACSAVKLYLFYTHSLPPSPLPLSSDSEVNCSPLVKKKDIHRCEVKLLHSLPSTTPITNYASKPQPLKLQDTVSMSDVFTFTKWMGWFACAHGKWSLEHGWWISDQIIHPLLSMDIDRYCLYGVPPSGRIYSGHINRMRCDAYTLFILEAIWGFPILTTTMSYFLCVIHQEAQQIAHTPSQCCQQGREAVCLACSTLALWLRDCYVLLNKTYQPSAASTMAEQPWALALQCLCSS